MLPLFFVGFVSFVSLLLLFQVLRLTDTLLQHGVSFRTIIHLLSYMSIGFIPIILPMSLIFSILMAYHRLSTDSEIIALKTLGVSMWLIMAPALVLAILVSLFCGYMSSKVGPWGTRQFEIMIRDIAHSKIISQVEAGVFSGDFFSLVVYANKINKETEQMEQVFIYDERDERHPTTIVAEKGEIFSERHFGSDKAFVRLMKGDIHKISSQGHTKIQFQTYDLQMVENNQRQMQNKSILSHTNHELARLSKTTKDLKRRREYQYEGQKRLALCWACLLFALMGVGLGCRSNHRSGKSNAMVMSVYVILVYWVLFIMGYSLLKSPAVPVILAAWLPLMVLLPWSLLLLRRHWN